MTKKKKKGDWTRPNFLVAEQQADGSTVFTGTQTFNEAFSANTPGQKILHEYLAIRTMTANESDRSTAIVVAAWIDGLLQSLLNAALVTGKSTTNLLCDHAPLYSFSARIDSAHAFGLIASEAWNDLRLMRDMRNEFAHSIDARDFSYRPALDQCNAFQVLDHLGKEKSPQAIDGATARARFLSATWALMAHLAKRLDASIAQGPRLPPTLEL